MVHRIAALVALAILAPSAGAVSILIEPLPDGYTVAEHESDQPAQVGTRTAFGKTWIVVETDSPSFVAVRTEKVGSPDHIVAGVTWEPRGATEMQPVLDAVAAIDYAPVLAALDSLVIPAEVNATGLATSTDTQALNASLMELEAAVHAARSAAVNATKAAKDNRVDFSPVTRELRDLQEDQEETHAAVQSAPAPPQWPGYTSIALLAVILAFMAWNQRGAITPPRVRAPRVPDDEPAVPLDVQERGEKIKAIKAHRDAYGPRATQASISTDEDAYLFAVLEAYESRDPERSVT